LYNIDSLLALHTASLAFPIPYIKHDPPTRRIQVEVDHSNPKVSSIHILPLPTFILLRSYDAPAQHIDDASGHLLDYAGHISNLNIGRYRNPKFPSPPSPLNPVNSPKHPNSRYTPPHIPEGPEYINLKSRTMDSNPFRRIYKLDS
jgi:hypothetical protein